MPAGEHPQRARHFEQNNKLNPSRLLLVHDLLGGGNVLGVGDVLGLVQGLLALGVLLLNRVEASLYLLFASEPGGTTPTSATTTTPSSPGGSTTTSPSPPSRAELQVREPGALRYDSKAAAVLGNIHAMEQAVHLASDAREITIETLKEVHRALCANTSLEEWGGIIRPMQNWVGGGGSNPLNAEFVPPAPQEVEALLDDLCEYANRTDVSPVVQAALCHAQFETIHPFVDGNGRVGRALIQSVLLRRRAVGNVVPPISLALATQRKDYYVSLNAYQHALDANLESRAVNDWVSCFCGAVCDASVDIEEISHDLQHIKDDWRNKLPRVRAGSTLELMLAKMQAMPYFTTETMVAATKRSKQAVGQAVSKLLEAQIICQTSRGKRSRVFEVPDILEEFNVVERRLASPSRDTSVDLPVRPVPNKHI